MKFKLVSKLVELPVINTIVSGVSSLHRYNKEQSVLYSTASSLAGKFMQVVSWTMDVITIPVRYQLMAVDSLACDAVDFMQVKCHNVIKSATQTLRSTGERVSGFGISQLLLRETERVLHVIQKTTEYAVPSVRDRRQRADVRLPTIIQLLVDWCGSIYNHFQYYFPAIEYTTKRMKKRSRNMIRHLRTWRRSIHDIKLSGYHNRILRNHKESLELSILNGGQAVKRKCSLVLEVSSCDENEDSIFNEISHESDSPVLVKTVSRNPSEKSEYFSTTEDEPSLLKRSTSLTSITSSCDSESEFQDSITDTSLLSPPEQIPSTITAAGYDTRRICTVSSNVQI